MTPEPWAAGSPCQAAPPSFAAAILDGGRPEPMSSCAAAEVKPVSGSADHQRAAGVQSSAAAQGGGVDGIPARGRMPQGSAGSSICCEGLTGWSLAWHRYSAHGGPYPRRSRRQREAASGQAGG